MADSIVLDEEDVPGAKLTEELNEWMVEEVKRWLECHGLKNCGKKDDLLERVRL